MRLAGDRSPGRSVSWSRSRSWPLPSPGGGPAGILELLWNQAHQALQSGDVAAAASLLDEIGRLRPPTALDWSLRAEIAVAGDRPDRALSALAHIPEDDPLAAPGLPPGGPDRTAEKSHARGRGSLPEGPRLRSALDRRP